MNYYEILNVNKNASRKEIKNSYKLLVKKYHPDVYPGDKTFAEKKIKEINSAYDVLSNENLRKEYDLSLKPNYYDNFDTSNFSDYSDTYSTDSEKTVSYTYTSTAENNYEKYKKVYDDYINKKTSSNYSSASYTNSKENYSDYYRSSAYKTPFSGSNYHSEEDSFIEKNIYTLPKGIVFIIIFIVYIAIVILDFTALPMINKTSKTTTNISYSNNTKNNNNKIDRSKYKDTYIINNTVVTLDELEYIYSYYYYNKFSNFDEFMEFIKEIEE